MSLTSGQEIFMIYARAKNGAIGFDSTMPWHLPEDLKHFKRLTMGCPMIMGRKTFQSLPGLLPGRPHIILTRDESWKADGVEVAHSLEEALELAASHAGEGSIAIVGGAQIYAQFLDHASRIELTEIQAEFDGDTFVPDLGDEWRETARESRPADDEKPALDFVTYKRAA